MNPAILCLLILRWQVTVKRVRKGDGLIWELHAVRDRERILVRALTRHAASHAGAQLAMRLDEESKATGVPSGQHF